MLNGVETMRKSNLKVLHGSNFPAGSEADVYRVQDGVYKKFKMSVKNCVREHKKEKLLYLKKLVQLVGDYPEIKYLVENFWRTNLNGYVMEEVFGNCLFTGEVSIEGCLEGLDDLFDVLERFRNGGMYYFDIRQPNIRVVDGKAVLLDVDSVMLFDDKEPDLLPYALKFYEAKGGKLDEHGQIFMFNNFVKEVFYYGELNWKLELDEVGREIMRSVDKVDTVYDHEYLHKHIKRFR